MYNVCPDGWFFANQHFIKLKGATIVTETNPRGSRNQRDERKHRLNREILVAQVRLSGQDNEPLGIVSIQEALQLATDQDVDLVEIAPTAVPPVCRLMDYGKFKYQEQKRAAEAKSKQVVVEIKEVKFRPGTDDGDYNIKMRNIKRFLAEGDKCKVTLRFRGREITHMEIGTALLGRIRDELGEYATIEQFPKLEGRQMIMMIAPGKKRFAEEKKAKPAEPKGSKAKHAVDMGDVSKALHEELCNLESASATTIEDSLVIESAKA